MQSPAAIRRSPATNAAPLLSLRCFFFIIFSFCRCCGVRFIALSLLVVDAELLVAVPAEEAEELLLVVAAALIRLPARRRRPRLHHHHRRRRQQEGPEQRSRQEAPSSRSALRLSPPSLLLVPLLRRLGPRHARLAAASAARRQ